MPEGWGGARVDLLWDSGSEATLWRDGEVLQGLYSGWRALRTVAPVLEPATGGEPVELAVEMACNSWAGDDPDPAPGVDPGLAARYRLGRNWSEGEAPPRAPTGWARLERCALARFDPDAWRLLWDLETLRRLEARGRARPRCGLGGHPARWAESVLQPLAGGASARRGSRPGRSSPSCSRVRARARATARSRSATRISTRRGCGRSPRPAASSSAPPRTSSRSSTAIPAIATPPPRRSTTPGSRRTIRSSSRGCSRPSPQGAGRSSAAHGSSRTATSPTGNR